MKMRSQVLAFALSLAWAGTLHAAEEFIGVVATDFATGKFNVMMPDAPWTMTCDAASICSDAVARWHGGLVYIVNRLGCDNIQVLDPEQNFATVQEFSVGSGSNPQGIAFAPQGGKAYVTRQNSNEVLIVDPATGDWLGAVDLSAWADADGYCEQGDCIAAKGLIFAAILRLDRDFNWLPVGDSYLAVIDPATDTLVDVLPAQPGIQAIALAGTNPAGELNAGPDGLIYATCTGYFVLADGGLERVDPLGLASLGMAVTESALGGDLGDAVIVDESLGYAVVSDANFNTKLKRFNPSTGGAVSTVAAGAGYVFFDMELDSTGELYLCDQSHGGGGVRIFDAASGTALGTVGGSCLPAYDILVPRESGTGVEESPAADRAGLTAWPNPFNPRTVLSWSGLPATDARLAIFDPAGRRVALLFAGEQPGSGTLEWDGRDAAGRPLPSGIYLARIEAGEATAALRLVLVK